MQVLDYQTAPIISQQSVAKEAVSNAVLNQAYHQKPIHEFFNNTFEAMNQTLRQVVDKVQAEKSLETTAYQQSFQDEWNLLYFIRLLFYVLVIFKIIELVFSKRKKMDIKQRVYRKYVFSHSEMIREFNDEDRKVMQTTLKNTIKNASIDKTLPKLTKKASNKKVMIFQTKNQYIEPRKSEQVNEGLSALQMFLSRPVKIQQMQRQMDEPSDKQFEIIETITEIKQNSEDSQSSMIKVTESTITQSTVQCSQNSYLRENNEQSKISEKDH